MIKRLLVDNYKCLVNFELPLQELSLLLGPSGVGKTAVLDIVHALRQLLLGDARVTDRDIFPTRTLTRWQSRNLQIIEIDVLLRSEAYTYRLEVEHEQGTQRARIHSERLTVDGDPLFEFVSGEVQLYRDDPVSGTIFKGPSYTADWRESALARVFPAPTNKRLTRFLVYMHRLLVCSIHPPGLLTDSTEEVSMLHHDGRNFADWYRHCHQERPDLTEALTNVLVNVVGGGFRRIQLERVGHDARSLTFRFNERGEGDSQDGYKLRFDEISDGQRALVVLYGLITLASDQGYTLFLDEPENYVALREIQPWLMYLSDATGETIPQAVVSSHHPELIDYLGYEHGTMLQRETSGVITVGRPPTTARATHETKVGLKLSELVARGWER
jgi:predicted ATPase